MQAQDRHGALPSATAASPSVPNPAPVRRSMLRPAESRSRVRGPWSRSPVPLSIDGTVPGDLVEPAADEIASIDGVLAGRAVEPLFQPIVELDGLRTVGVEALARGPAGTD